MSQQNKVKKKEKKMKMGGFDFQSNSKVWRR